VRGALAAATLAIAAVALPGAQAPHGVETFDAAWTIVRDSHFDPGMNGVDWNAVKTELRPKAVAAKNDDELRRVIREMLGRLGQSHFALIPASADSSTGGKSDLTADPGFESRLIDRTLVVTRLTPGGAAAGAGVKLGWVVDAIDGKSVSSAFAGLPDATSRSGGASNRSCEGRAAPRSR
jgi:carboxyl-terminal processing protease